jgi:BolA family transcriptional regulator, general stress-responsive regulator
LIDLSQTIQDRLASLNPISLSIQDDSAGHVGHKGNTGGGHFTLKVVSSHFSQQSLVLRHRLVYQLLADLIPQQIHALSILAIAPDDPT